MFCSAIKRKEPGAHLAPGWLSGHVLREPVPKGYIPCDSIYDSEKDRGQVSAARGQGWGGARKEVFGYKGQNEGSQWWAAVHYLGRGGGRGSGRGSGYMKPHRWENCTELNIHTCHTCKQAPTHETVQLGRCVNVTAPAVIQ